ncbi:MAG: ABC transporter permease, partial [Chloroflexi bacterium]|nr:ABC transporter permease [Chloroflexota bacterium]
AGYSASALEGTPAKLTLVYDPAGAAGQAAQQAVQALVARVLSEAEIARLSVERVAAIEPFENAAARAAAETHAVAQAAAAWRDARLGITVEKAGLGAEAKASGFSQASPGMIVQFAIFGLTTSAMILVLERKTRTLQRILTTPVGRARIIAGHWLAMFVLVFAQETILVAAGQWLFGVDYARSPAGVMLIMAALALWTSSLGMLIGTWAKGEEQVILWSLIAMFVFSALGGAWFPLEGTGAMFAAIGHLTPSAWAMDGFQNIVVRGLAWSTTLVPAGILAGYSAVFFGLAVWRLREE